VKSRATEPRDQHHGSPTLDIQYKQALGETLRKVRRQKLLITAIIGIAQVLGVIATLAMPKQYTEAYIREGVAASDSAAATRESSGRSINFGASLLVGTRSRLFESRQLARRVVKNSN
jgi:uncharacterized protein involved in exopolysaccharide biosynthesis